MSSLSDLRWQLEIRLSRLIEDEAAARHWHQAWIERATQAQRQETEAATRRYEQRLRDIRKGYDQAISDVTNRAKALQKSGGLAWVGWEDASWSSWRAAPVPLSGRASQPVAGSVRIGWLKMRGPWQEELKLPAISPLLGAGHLIFRAPQAVREACFIAAQTAILRLVAALPPGQLRPLILDTSEFALRWAPFMKLGKFDPALVSAKVFSGPDEVSQRIVDLAANMQTGGASSSITESNTLKSQVPAAPSRPYTLVAMIGPPPSNNEATAQAFSRLLTQGPRNGISIIGVFASEQPLPAGLSANGPQVFAEVLAWEDSHFVWQRDLARTGSVTLDPLPDVALRDHILAETAKAAAEVFHTGVAFDVLRPTTPEWGRTAADQGLIATIGVGSGGYAQELRLGYGATQHALLAGAPERARAGLLNVLATSLALRHSPNDLWFYLVSLRRTSGFETYATKKLPHARVVAVDCDREYALSVLQEVMRTAAARGQSLPSGGAETPSIANAPRRIVVLDDLEQFLSPDDELARQAAEILRSLATLNAEQGVHLVLASENPSSIVAHLPVLGTSWCRLVLPCAEGEAAHILASDGAAAVAQLGAGDVLFNDAGGASYGSRRLRVATLTEEARTRHLQDMVKSVDSDPQIRPAPLTFYQRGIAADIGNNRQVAQYLLATPSQDAGLVSTPIVWLGEPPVLADPVGITLARQSANNLLVVTPDRGQATGMLVAAAAGLMPQAATVLFLQLDRLTGPGAETVGRLARIFPKAVQVVAPDDVPSVLAEQLAVLQKRMSLEHALSAQRQEQEDKATILILYGLQKLASEDAGVVSIAEQALESVTELLREGPDIGIHSLAWCDRLFSLNSVLGWQALRHFSMRAVGQLAAEDSEALVETADAQQLTPNQMLLFDRREGRRERFKPYALPAVAWMDEIERQFAVRGKR